MSKNKVRSKKNKNPFTPELFAQATATGRNGNVKFDHGKHPVYTLFLDYFPRACLAVANVSEYGSRKYHAKGWVSVPNAIPRYSDADLRHLMLESIEGPYDINDSGLAHAAQHAWNALARLELMLERGFIQDRRGNEIGPDGKPILTDWILPPVPPVIL